ncbi:MAG: SusC/RagA family TonB-linked outer membrane protein [Bacteroidales bacterium]|nr:SusC/RagA family TonB-linked outer membrane protein [Bacteroidales bacterium]
MNMIDMKWNVSHSVVAFITFFLLFMSGSALAQNSGTAVLKGTVTDSSDGFPLIGVSVIVEGKKYGVITDLDGNYELRFPKQTATIVFSYVGYDDVEKEYNLKNEASFSKIVMYMNATELEDVIVTGVYERKKESFTGASATFKTDQLKAVGTNNVLQSLKTLDPSFKMMESAQFGSNPNMMPDVEIRGKTSVMGLKEEYGTDPNQPLFILDGFETTIETIMNLNMNRVASVTILKDAASTAIYGSKASNGVVVIETKAPARGRLQLSYKGDYGLSMADLTDYNLMNAREKLQFETLAGVYTDRSGSPFTQIQLDALRNERLKEIERGVDTYWLSEPIRSGVTHKHNIYAEGGEDKIRYGIGLSYGNVAGVMKGSDRQTLEGNVDLIYRTGKFQFSNKLTIDYLETANPTVSFSEYAYANPYYRKYNALGKVDKYLYYSEDGIGSTVTNPLWDAHLNNWDKASGFGFTNNFIFEWFVTEDLRMRAKFGLSKSDDDEQTRLSPLHSSFDEVGETEKGLYSRTQIQQLVYEGDVSVTFGKLIAQKHMLNAVGGFNFSNNSQHVYGYSANGFTDDQFDAPSFANGYPVDGKPDYRETLKRAVSFYVNGGYVYDDRYLMDFNYRLDGASMFGTGNRFRNTWSVGLGWNVHKEHFLKDNDFFSFFKIRGSVGNPGNQNFSAYQAFSTYKFNGWMTNIFGTGVILNALGNAELAWQETVNYDIGADLTFWGERVNLTLDYFWKDTDPLLAIITTRGSMGVTSVAMNAGRQHTKGWEATFKISPIYRPAERINWNISINAAHSRSRYADIGNAFSALNESGKSSLVGTTRYYDGGSPTAIWAVRSAGIDPATGQEVFIKKDGSYSLTYDVSDEVVVGDTQPSVEGIFGSTLYFKGLSVGCYFRYRVGGQVFNTSLFQKVENIGTEDVYNNQDKRALYDRWSPDNREAYFKGISMVQKTEKSSRFVMDENTLTGESVNIGYEFPDRMIRRLRISALNLQLTMTDMFRASTVRVERGIDYPFARSVTMSLGITF